MSRYLIALAVFVGFTSSALAEGDHTKKKSKYHCEKLVDGKTKDLPDVKTRKECKKNGGKWKKAHKGDDHKHDEEDGHDHK